MIARTPGPSTDKTPLQTVIAGLLGTIGAGVVFLLVLLAKSFAWLLPVGCAAASLTRLARTFTRAPRKAEVLDRRRARLSASMGLLLAGGEAVGLWIVGNSGGFGAAVYVGCALVWFFAADVWAREAAALVGAGPLLGRFRPRLDSGLESASNLLNLPWLATFFGVREKPELTAFDVVAIATAFLLGIGVAGADELLKEKMFGGATSNPERVTQGSTGQAPQGSQGDGPEVKGERIYEPVYEDPRDDAPSSGAGPLTPDDCLYPQREQFLKGIRNNVGDALFDAWENVGVKIIGCLEKRVQRVGKVWLAPLSGWGYRSGLVVSDKKTRAAVVFHQLRDEVEALVADRLLLYAGDRVPLEKGDFQVLFLVDGSCRLAIRYQFGDDAPYLLLPSAVTVLVVEDSIATNAFPTSITERYDKEGRVFVVDYGTAGSYSPAALRIVMTKQGGAYVASDPDLRSDEDSPCPDVRHFDALAAAP